MMAETVLYDCSFTVVYVRAVDSIGDESIRCPSGVPVVEALASPIPILNKISSTLDHWSLKFMYSYWFRDTIALESPLKRFITLAT